MFLNNWVVILCSSKYFFNYRHLTNALVLYKIVRDFGIPDDHIIFLNAMDVPHDPRNRLLGQVYAENDEHASDRDNLYQDVELDYINEEVTVDTFIQLLTGRNTGHIPYSKQLLSDENSNILIFMSGHGGDQFFKFQDHEEISSLDLGAIFHEMHIKKRYKEILFIIDTCQASTLADYITSPNIITIASSKKGENSYSYYSDDILGVSLIDRFSYSIYQFFKQYYFHHHPTISFSHNGYNNNYNDNSNNVSKLNYNLTLQSLIKSIDARFLRSTLTVITTKGSRAFDQIYIHEYFMTNQNRSVFLL